MWILPSAKGLLLGSDPLLIQQSHALHGLLLGGPASVDRAWIAPEKDSTEWRNAEAADSTSALTGYGSKGDQWVKTITVRNAKSNVTFVAAIPSMLDVWRYCGSNTGGGNRTIDGNRW